MSFWLKTIFGSSLNAILTRIFGVLFMLGGFTDVAIHNFLINPSYGVVAWTKIGLVGIGTALCFGAIFWECKKSPPSRYRPAYNKDWEKTDQLEPWQAACLWVGKEPIRPIEDGSKPYPVLKMLNAAIDKGQLKLVRPSPPALHRIISREALLEYAQAQHKQVPKFLKDSGSLKKSWWPFN